MSREDRALRIDKNHVQLSVREQCELLALNRAVLYYEPVKPTEETLELLKAIDRIFTERPYFGARRIQVYLKEAGHSVSRKRIRRLMQILGLEAIYPRPNTSKSAPGHKIYPYLLRGLDINRPNQVWSADITYIPMKQGFVYVVAVIDWYSRLVLSWAMSNTMDADFCVAALKDALQYGQPEIFNTDQGSQFTSEGFVNAVLEGGSEMSMDGRGRWADNVFVERLWRSLKYEEVYLHGYENTKEARSSIGTWFRFYNTERPHQALEYKRPIHVHNAGLLSWADSTGTTAPALIIPSTDLSPIFNDQHALHVVSSNSALGILALPQK